MKVIKIEGLEKKLKLNKEGEVKDLFFPVILSNLIEKYSHKQNVIDCIYKTNIPSYAILNDISTTDAIYNINCVREAQGLEMIELPGHNNIYVIGQK